MTRDYLADQQKIAGVIIDYINAYLSRFDSKLNSDIQKVLPVVLLTNYNKEFTYEDGLTLVRNYIKTILLVIKVLSFYDPNKPVDVFYSEDNDIGDLWFAKKLRVNKKDFDITVELVGTSDDHDQDIHIIVEITCLADAVKNRMRWTLHEVEKDTKKFVDEIIDWINKVMDRGTYFN